MIVSQQQQPPSTPRSEYELRQYVRQISRDIGAVYREFKQHIETLMMLQIAAYAELEQCEARRAATFPWQPQQQPPVRVSPVSMPLRPQINHLHAGQQQGTTGRMRFAEEAEAPTLPDPWPEGGQGGRRTNG